MAPTERVAATTERAGHTAERAGHTAERTVPTDDAATDSTAAVPSTTGVRHRPVSLLLRLLPGPAADGTVVGQVETVATGEITVVRADDDLAAIVCALATGH